MRLRRGGTDDVPTLMLMFDEAVAWLTERGSGSQWCRCSRTGSGDGRVP
ncbi:hypothetical protein [Nocardiopsis sp. JB363]|nr:hypothetical protein [Nocardiopsis sp. JB363]SIO84448.1 hypothetical protein BQ8420_01950 [Nocardiopsis sp. JB363]